METKSIISSNTLIPLSLLGIIIGAVIWVVNVNAKTQTNTESIKEVKNEILGVRQDTVNLTERTTRIETKIDYIVESIKR